MTREVEHGTSNAYIWHRCRCDTCREGNRRRMAEQVCRWHGARTLVDGVLVAPMPGRHGSVSTYRNHGCRCAECRAAHAEDCRRRRHRREARRS